MIVERNVVSTEEVSMKPETVPSVLCGLSAVRIRIIAAVQHRRNFECIKAELRCYNKVVQHVGLAISP